MTCYPLQPVEMLLNGQENLLGDGAAVALGEGLDALPYVERQNQIESVCRFLHMHKYSIELCICQEQMFGR